MTDIRIETDRDRLTVTLHTDVSVPPQRLWEALTEPRQLERFWGPPTWPATFGQLDVRPGGSARYHMTGPDGSVAGGTWEVVTADPPRSFTVIDRFVDDDGQIDATLPATNMEFRVAESAAGARLEITSTFPTELAMERLIEMGMVEGLRQATGQLDLVVTGLSDLPAATGTTPEILDDTTVRITRVMRGTAEAVWSMFSEPELIQQWMLGPEGWTMPVCEFEARAGSSYHWGWAPEAGTVGEPFGFHGTVRLVEPGRRLVTTEAMDDEPGDPCDVDLSLHSDGAHTLVVYVITYPDAATRDAVMASGMVAGMEGGFNRMQHLLDMA